MATVSREFVERGQGRLSREQRRIREYYSALLRQAKARLQNTKTDKDREPLPGDEPVVSVCNKRHRNVRGAEYYSQESLTGFVNAEKGG